MKANPQPAMNGSETNPKARNWTSLHGTFTSHTFVSSVFGNHSSR